MTREDAARYAQPMGGKVTTIRSSRLRRTPQRTRSVLQFLVVLSNTNPLVWRRIQVPEKYSFWDLHVAIQDAMGWQDYHLHEFRVVHPKRGKLERLGIPDEDFPDERPCVSDWEVPISEYFDYKSLQEAPSVLYVYDFGDGWHHLVTFEETLPVDASLHYPRCVAGARACPPEDCGGVRGYTEFLEAIADPEHPEHSQLVQWSGGAYDPETFDPTRIAFDDPRQRWTKAFRE